MYKFSVVLPCFNITKYLNKCLDSIFNNGFSQPIEIILVNDGSTDGFERVVSEYFLADCSGEYVELIHKNNKVVIVNKVNAGLSDARNCGMKHCTGEYILFIDPDDYVLNGYFEYLSIALHEECDMFILGYIKSQEDSKGNLVKEKVIFPIKKYDYSSNVEVVNNLFGDYFGISFDDLEYGDGNFLPQKEHGGVWRVCYRKKFLDENALIFDVGLKTNEDRFFNSRCIACAKRVRSDNKAFYHYSVRDTGLFNNRNKKDMINNKLISLKIRKEIVEKLKNDGYNVGIRSYAGSNVLSAIELMGNLSIRYYDVCRYLKNADVKKSIKIIRYIGNIKFDISLFLLKNKMSWLLFVTIRVLKIFGISI